MSDIEQGRVEYGRSGRLIYTRVRPNEDLVQTVEKVCLELGLKAAMVRGSLGSLTQAVLDYGQAKPFEVEGPAVELLTIQGEVRLGQDGVPHAHLAGTVADPNGRVYGGRFVSGRNPVCITFELVLEEWLAEVLPVA